MGTVQSSPGTTPGESVYYTPGNKQTNTKQQNKTSTQRNICVKTNKQTNKLMQCLAHLIKSGLTRSIFYGEKTNKVRYSINTILCLI